MQKTTNLTIILILFQCAFLSAAQIRTCKLGNICGQLPARICELNSKFIQQKLMTLYGNKLLLYGPQGNNKTEIAEEFARLAQAEIRFYSGTNIITKFQGSGPSKIHAIFESAHYAEYPLVICIDNIDSFITCDNNDSDDPEYLAMLQLCIELDQIEKKTNVFVICTADDRKNLPFKLLNRFGPNNQCQIMNPTIESRLDLIKSILSDNEHLQFDNEIMQYLAQETYDFSISDIKDLCYNIANFTRKKISKKEIDSIIKEFCKKNSIEERKTFFKKNAKKIAALIATLGITSYAITRWYKNYKRTKAKKIQTHQNFVRKKSINKAA